MLHRFSSLPIILLAFLVTCAQIAIAVGFSNPEGSWGERYRTLVQHDSYWFANIIDRGYGTTVPPIQGKEMEVSNVAFFPAYPLLVSALRRLTNLAFQELVPESDLANVLAAADFLLLNQRATVRNMSLPAKLGLYFAAGVPVVAAVAEEDETATELAAAQAGVRIEPGEPARGRSSPRQPGPLRSPVCNPLSRPVSQVYQTD